jgi:hypothetical protein
MMKKARQSLDTTLAGDVVLGATATPQTPTTSTPLRSALMDKLITPEKEATVRITVDLPKSMHKSLSILAATTGRKKADIIRTLLIEVLPADNA